MGERGGGEKISVPNEPADVGTWGELGWTVAEFSLLLLAPPHLPFFERAGRNGVGWGTWQRPRLDCLCRVEGERGGGTEKKKRGGEGDLITLVIFRNRGEGCQPRALPAGTEDMKKLLGSRCFLSEPAEVPAPERTGVLSWTEGDTRTARCSSSSRPRARDATRLPWSEPSAGGGEDCGPGAGGGAEWVVEARGREERLKSRCSPPAATAARRLSVMSAETREVGGRRTCRLNARWRSSRAAVCSLRSAVRPATCCVNSSARSWLRCSLSRRLSASRPCCFSASSRSASACSRHASCSARAWRFVLEVSSWRCCIVMIRCAFSSSCSFSLRPSFASVSCCVRSAAWRCSWSLLSSSTRARSSREVCARCAWLISCSCLCRVRRFSVRVRSRCAASSSSCATRSREVASSRFAREPFASAASSCSRSSCSACRTSRSSAFVRSRSPVARSDAARSGPTTPSCLSSSRRRSASKPACCSRSSRSFASLSCWLSNSAACRHSLSSVWRRALSPSRSLRRVSTSPCSRSTWEVRRPTTVRRSSSAHVSSPSSRAARSAKYFFCPASFSLATFSPSTSRGRTLCDSIMRSRPPPPGSIISSARCSPFSPSRCLPQACSNETSILGKPLKSSHNPFSSLKRP
eukprot:Hpha_TRINITY_DN16647_c3_g3::TRINITY_DN16647_c3_g3_i2::g.181504::m.181504